MAITQRFIVDEIRIDKLDIRKIVPPKWYFIFIPWKWAHFFIYKKRQLRPVFIMEKPVVFTVEKKSK